MINFVTIQSVIDGLSVRQLTRILDVEEDELEINPTLIQSVSWANATISSYVGNKITLPQDNSFEVSTLFPTLTKAGIDLVRWNILSTRGDVEDEIDRFRYEDAMKYLKDIASDRASVNLGVQSSRVGASVDGNNVNNLNVRCASKILNIVPENPYVAYTEY